MIDTIIENYQDIILHSARIFSSVFEIVLAYLLANYFFKPRSRLKKFDYLPFFLLASAVILLQEYMDLGNFRYVAECVILSVFLFLLYEGKLKDKLIGSLIFCSIIAVSVLLSDFFFGITKTKLELITDESSPFAVLIRLTLCNIIMIPVSVLISTLLKSNAGGIRTLRVWMGLLLVPVVTLLTLSVFLYLIETYRPETHIIAYIYISCIGIILINALVFVLFWFNQHQQSIRRENDILTTQINLQEASIKNLENAYNRTRHFRHDIKNHLLTMNILAENGDLPEIKKYLKEMSGVIDESSYIRITGISSVDAILNEKLYEAQSNSILTNYDVSSFTDCRIKPLDMCIILSNALDNAIEANCKIDDPDMRNIKLRLQGDRGFTVLSVSNPVKSEPVRISANSYATSKKDKDSHGFGLKSIESTVKKYNGDMLIKCDDGMFTLVIKLNAPESKEETK